MTTATQKYGSPAARAATHGGDGARAARTRTGSTCRRSRSSSCFFLLPTFASFYYSLTRWTLFDCEFIGLDNFRQFFQEPALARA